MRRALFVLLLALCLPALAPGAGLAQGWVERRTAELQALDKVTARVSVIRATLGQPLQFGTLTILVRACHARPPDEVPDAAAWLDITDSRSPPGSGPVFRGWLFAVAPAVNMLEHPVYDLRVLSCR